MIIAIIAGGPGSRLWPLSTPEYPKHLLRVAGEDSLLQMAYKRAKHLTDDIWVVTEVGHAHLVKEQLSELPESAFTVEPARRNTSACFLAVLRRAQQRASHDEPIAIIWADHFVHDVRGFARTLIIAGEASRKSVAPVVVGVEPTYPNTALGYIRKGELLPDEQIVYHARDIKEKPLLKQAQAFWRSGEYLWNCGYLVGTLTAFTKAMQADCPKLWADYQTLLKAKTEAAYQKAYLALESISLDYTFNELVSNMLVVSGTFDWQDLGNFQDLYNASDADEQGNVVVGPRIALADTERAYVRNDGDKPLAVIGLDNVVVIHTPNGILVARMDQAQKVREITKQFE